MLVRFAKEINIGATWRRTELLESLGAAVEQHVVLNVVLVALEGVGHARRRVARARWQSSAVLALSLRVAACWSSLEHLVWQLGQSAHSRVARGGCCCCG